MQVFRCPACSAPIYFHNLGCDCGQQVAFDPAAQAMVPAGGTCRNRADIACNWTPERDGFCRSCAMTETVPDLRAPQNLPLWSRTELAKRWVLASLGRWGWFTQADRGMRPEFRLLSETTATGETDVTMGHANGTITINVTEASDTVLIERQETLGELYRTMIGHMRHEIAHFLFLRLSSDPAFLADFRARFGDESADYGAALAAHYADPQPGGQAHITSYAASHPHEDWAETIAHLLHLVDLLDSAAHSRLALPDGPPPGYDAYADGDTERLLGMAVEMTLAVNHVNRALDLPDLYPFVLSPQVRRKLAFAHDALRIGAPG